LEGDISKVKDDLGEIKNLLRRLANESWFNSIGRYE
jgi:hypothetical protein